MRAFFFRRTPRERWLTLLFVVVLLGLWGVSAFSRLGALRQRLHSTGQELAAQQQWLDNRLEIEARLAQGLATVREGRTLNASQLVGQIDALVRRHRFNFRLDSPASERRPPVAIHSITLALEKAELGPFVSFVNDLRDTLPLVNIDQLTMSADRRNPAQIDIRLRLSSLEIVP
jgi:hypothetical protein